MGRGWWLIVEDGFARSAKAWAVVDFLIHTKTRARCHMVGCRRIPNRNKVEHAICSVADDPPFAPHPERYIQAARTHRIPGFQIDEIIYSW